MQSLLQIIKAAEKAKMAIGHFNISDLATLKAVYESARELNVPVIIGTSEGEANFLDRKEAAALVKTLREQNGFPIFINSDHTHSLEGVKDAMKAGYDAILFDAAKLPLEENIRETKKIVDYIKCANPRILVEGELGYIGDSSKILKEIPVGAAINSEDLTSAEQAEEFVARTGVDLLAPAVGNIHGVVKGGNPVLDIARIKKIRKLVDAPLVLHGGSGVSDSDFTKAINAGISIIHINTEIRMAWRKGLEESLKEHPEELAPYKILPEAVEEIKTVVKQRLKLFNKLV